MDWKCLKKKFLALRQKRIKESKFICYKVNSILSPKKHSFKHLMDSTLNTPLKLLIKVVLTSKLSSTKDNFQCSYCVKWTALGKPNYSFPFGVCDENF